MLLAHFTFERARRDDHADASTFTEALDHVPAVETHGELRALWSGLPAGPSERKRATHLPQAGSLTPAARAACRTVQPSSTTRETMSALPFGPSGASAWIFIRNPVGSECHDTLRIEGGSDEPSGQVLRLNVVRLYTQPAQCLRLPGRAGHARDPMPGGEQ